MGSRCVGGYGNQVTRTGGNTRRATAVQMEDDSLDGDDDDDDDEIWSDQAGKILHK